MSHSAEHLLQPLQRLIKHPKQVKQIHCLVIITGHLRYNPNSPPNLKWMSTLFYNTLIRAHHIAGLTHKALVLFTQMLADQAPPNSHTFPPLIKSAASFPCLGRALHSQVIKRGVLFNPFVQTTFVAFYARNKILADACKMFEEIPLLCIVACNAMLHAFCTNGNMGSAVSLFERMPKRDVVSWTTIINGFAANRYFGKAIQFFKKMMIHQDVMDCLVKPNEATYVSVLSCCASLDGKGTLDWAKQVHAYIVINDINLGVFMGTSLIDLYGKMGCLDYAVNVFNQMVSKEVWTWNAMISSFSSNSREKDALSMFEKMKANGLQPNNITFVAVLTACARGKLVKEGLTLFRSMSHDFGVVPIMEHYGCVIDLLGRAGHLKEAADILRSMPFEPDATVLGALLGACKIHGAIELGEEIGRRLLELQPSQPQLSGKYVLLSSINAGMERWDQAADMRKEMMEAGILKIPAYSTVHIHDRTLKL